MSLVEFFDSKAIEILDPSFARYRIYSSTVEQICSGLRWAEGPVYFGDGRYLLVSDVPNNRIMRYDETTGQTGVEMEALTACSVAALTLYDMCKSADKDMVIGEIALWEKSGGRSGEYKKTL